MPPHYGTQPMTDLTLHDLRPKVLDRLQRLAELQGIAIEVVTSEALAIGLDAIEDRVRKQLLTTREQVVLKEAITEIQKVPDGSFGMIGRLARRE